MATAPASTAADTCRSKGAVSPDRSGAIVSTYIECRSAVPRSLRMYAASMEVRFIWIPAAPSE